MRKNKIIIYCSISLGNGYDIEENMILKMYYHVLPILHFSIRVRKKDHSIS